MSYRSWPDIPRASYWLTEDILCHIKVGPAHQWHHMTYRGHPLSYRRWPGLPRASYDLPRAYFILPVTSYDLLTTFFFLSKLARLTNGIIWLIKDILRHIVGCLANQVRHMTYRGHTLSYRRSFVLSKVAWLTENIIWLVKCTSILCPLAYEDILWPNAVMLWLVGNSSILWLTWVSFDLTRLSFGLSGILVSFGLRGHPLT